MTPRLRPTLAPLALLLVAGCQPLPVDPTMVPVLDPARDYAVAEGEPGANDVARFLAGRPVERGAALSRIQVSQTRYHTHALEFDFLWRKMGLIRTDRQALYFDEQLRPRIGSPSTIVYPFGGPDLLYVSSMFPRASTYVLLGLEQVGGVPDVGTDPYPLLGGLAAVMDEPLRHGYFISEQMRRAPDATPIFLTTLGLMDAEVRSVRSIDAAGRPGVEIRFRHQGRSKRLLYVRADLSNGGFNASLQQWLDQFGGATAYFKAASYLPHDSNFSEVRDWVLASCNSVVQDDSGIPYRRFDPERWEVSLLGTYERPIPLFSEWRQPDLAAAYDAIGGAGPEVPFGSGYHLKVRDANLQVARRK